MSAERFNVILEGTTLRGEAVTTVAAELAKLIKRDNDFAALLLRGQPTRIKSDVDAAAGARHVEALQRIGVAVRLEPETLEVDSDLAALKPPVAPRKKESAADGAAMAWPRVWARQIDFALCWAIAMAPAVLIGEPRLLTTSGIFLQLAVGAVLISVVLIGYETLLLVAFGTTLGKAALGLRVETRASEKIELGRALARSLSVWWNGSYAYLFFPGLTLIAWWKAHRRLRKTGSTMWDDSCLTRVAGGPVPIWRATLAGVVAITASTLVFGLTATERMEVTRIAQATIDRQYGLSGALAASPGLRRAPNPFVDPNFGKTSVGALDKSSSSIVDPFAPGYKPAPAARPPADSAADADPDPGQDAPTQDQLAWALRRYPYLADKDAPPMRAVAAWQQAYIRHGMRPTLAVHAAIRGVVDNIKEGNGVCVPMELTPEQLASIPEAKRNDTELFAIAIHCPQLN